MFLVTFIVKTLVDSDTIFFYRFGISRVLLVFMQHRTSLIVSPIRDVAIFGWSVSLQWVAKISQLPLWSKAGLMKELGKNAMLITSNRIGLGVSGIESQPNLTVIGERSECKFCSLGLPEPKNLKFIFKFESEIYLIMRVLH